MNEQDYKTITPKDDKKPVKYRNYTTGADEDAITELITGASQVVVTIDPVTAQQHKTVNVDATSSIRLQRLLIERFVIEVDGKSDGIVAAIGELRGGARMEIVSALMKLTQPIQDRIGGGDDEKKA